MLGIGVEGCEDMTRKRVNNEMISDRMKGKNKIY